MDEKRLLLAIETSGARGGVALARGAELVAERWLGADRRHAAELLPAIVDGLGQHGATLQDVQLVAYSWGPGSFTGLRVGATVARMLHGDERPVVAVPTLAAVALNARERGGVENDSHVAAVLPAGRGQVYAGLYRFADEEPAAVEPAAIVLAREWLAGLPRPLVVVGDGVKADRAMWAAADGARVLDERAWAVRPAAVAELGWRMFLRGAVCERQEIAPLYIRPPACEEVYEQKRAEARARRGE